jgi:hypothetical protein
VNPKIAGLSAFLTGLWLALGARAEGSEPVDVLTAGPNERVEAMDRALQDPFERLPITVSWSHAERVDPKIVIDRGGQAKDAFARIFIDLSKQREVTLYFVDAPWERILVRHVVLEHDLDDVEREEISQIVRSAVEALLGGATIGISREQARAELAPETVERPRAKPAPKPAPRAPLAPPPTHVVRSGIGTDVGGFYEAEVYGDALWQGPGLFAGAETRNDVHWGGRVTLSYRTPIEVRGDRLGARLQAIVLRALGRVSWSSSGFALAGAAGVGGDFTYVDPEGVADGVRPANARWDLVPAARALGAAGWISPSAGLWAFAGADADLIETRYVASRGGQDYTPLSIPRVRPFFGVELGVALE